MLEVILLVLVLCLIWRNGCCIKRRISGVMCPSCARCECKNCPICGKKQTCPKCPVLDPSEGCKCPPCAKYKCDLKEAFENAEEVRQTEGIKEAVKVEKVPPAPDKKPMVKVQKPPIAKTVPDVVAKTIKPTVAVEVPPPPPCKCPSCPRPLYDSATYTYYPIYQPLPYGVRY